MDGLGVFCRTCQTLCNCQGCRPGPFPLSYGATGNQEADPQVFTIDSDIGNQLRTSLFGLSQSVSVAGLAFPAAVEQLPVEYHVTSNGDTLASVASRSDNEFVVVLSGSIGPIPVQLQLRGRIDIGNREIEIGIKLLKPIETDEFVWRFALSGLVDLGGGRYMATNIVLRESDTPQFVSALGLSWWCVLKCGGLAILGILVRCLPSLAGGIPGYIACVTAQAGAGAASIAVCIARKCA